MCPKPGIVQCDIRHIRVPPVGPRLQINLAPCFHESALCSLIISWGERRQKTAQRIIPRLGCSWTVQKGFHRRQPFPDQAYRRSNNPCLCPWKVVRPRDTIRLRPDVWGASTLQNECLSSSVHYAWREIAPAFPTSRATSPRVLRSSEVKLRLSVLLGQGLKEALRSLVACPCLGPGRATVASDAGDDTVSEISALPPAWNTAVTGSRARSPVDARAGPGFP